MIQYKYPKKKFRKNRYWYDYGGDLVNDKLNQNIQDVSAFSKTNGINGIDNLTNAALGFTKPYSEERNKDIGKNIGSAIGVAAGMGLGALGIPPQIGVPISSALLGGAGEWIGGQIAPNRINVSSVNRSIYIPTKEDLMNTQTLNKSNSIQYSMGGNIQQGGFRNLPITRYKGNNHENGGIPLGNTNNEVEGGEVRIGNYIFSDRLFLPNKKTTFAQEAKRLENKYPNSNGDNISKNAFIREISQLGQLQETIRNIKQNNENNYENEDLGNQQYAEGGYLNNNKPLPDKFIEFIQKYYKRYKENKKPYKNEVLDTNSDEYKIVENFNKQNENLLEDENAPSMNNIDFLKMNQYAKNKINKLAKNEETYDYMREYLADRGAKYYTPSYDEIVQLYKNSLYHNANKKSFHVVPNINYTKKLEKYLGPKTKEEFQQLEDKSGIKTFIQNDEENYLNNNKKYAYGGPFKRINISDDLKYAKQGNETEIERFNRLNEQYMNDITLSQNDKKNFDNIMNQKREEMDRLHIPTSGFRYFDEAPESIRYLNQSGRIEEAKRLNREYNKFIDLVLDKNANYISGPGSAMNLWNGLVHKYKQEFGDVPRQVYVGEKEEDIKKMAFGGFKDQDPEEERVYHEEDTNKVFKKYINPNITDIIRNNQKLKVNNFLRTKELIEKSINPLPIKKKKNYSNGGGVDDPPSYLSINPTKEKVINDIMESINYSGNKKMNQASDYQIGPVYINALDRNKNKNNQLLSKLNTRPEIKPINVYNSNENDNLLNKNQQTSLKENLKFKIPNINWDELFSNNNNNVDWNEIENKIKNFAPYTLSELGGLYDIYRGLQGGVPEHYGRLPYINLNKLDPTQSIREIREQGNYAQNAVKNMGNLGYSQYLNNINNIRQNTGKQIGNVINQYDNANASILNQNKLQNLQNLEKNLQYDIAENDINARERDEAQNTLQRGLTALGQGFNQYYIDKNAKKSQDVVLQLMETKDFVPQLSIVDKNGKRSTIMAKKIIHPTTGKVYYADKNNDIYDSNGNYYSDFNTFLNK